MPDFLQSAPEPDDLTPEEMALAQAAWEALNPKPSTPSEDEKS